MVCISSFCADSPLLMLSFFDPLWTPELISSGCSLAPDHDGLTPLILSVRVIVKLSNLFLVLGIGSAR